MKSCRRCSVGVTFWITGLLECPLRPTGKDFDVTEAIDPVENSPSQLGEACPVVGIEQQLCRQPQVACLNQQLRPITRRITMQNRVAQCGRLERPVEEPLG